MPFVTVPGLTGKVYVPASAENALRKHDCPDCFACQHCGAERCRVCRREACRSSCDTPIKNQDRR